MILAERLKTTEAKAKEMRCTLEQWITLAKRIISTQGATQLNLRRQLLGEVQDQTVIKKLITDVAKRTQNRPSGYIRILKLGRRLGDAAPRVLVEFVDKPTPVKEKPKIIKKASAETKKA